jgi:hypothetical protein
MTALEDIAHVEAWVQSRCEHFAHRGRPMNRCEAEELHAQGIVILYELHAAWERKRCERFSAYAISLFGRRLVDWHRHEMSSSNRGHSPGRVGGKPVPAMVYHGMVSLDAPALDGTVQAFAQDRALTHHDPT